MIRPVREPVVSAIKSFKETVRGAKNSCVNSMPIAMIRQLVNISVNFKIRTRAGSNGRSQYAAARKLKGMYSKKLAIKSARDPIPSCR